MASNAFLNAILGDGPVESESRVIQSHDLDGDSSCEDDMMPVGLPTSPPPSRCCSTCACKSDKNRWNAYNSDGFPEHDQCQACFSVKRARHDNMLQKEFSDEVNRDIDKHHVFKHHRREVHVSRSNNTRPRWTDPQPLSEEEKGEVLRVVPHDSYATLFTASATHPHTTHRGIEGYLVPSKELGKFAPRFWIYYTYEELPPFLDVLVLPCLFHHD